MHYYKDLQNNVHVLDSVEFEYLLPTGSIQISDEEADDILARLPAVTPRYVPQAVSRYKALAALYISGLLQQVEVMMDDPSTDPLTVLGWKNAQEFKRTSQMVLGIAKALDLTDKQVDDLFVAAEGIE